jgi:hypothetical protein
MTTLYLDRRRNTFEGGLFGHYVLYNLPLAQSVERRLLHKHHVEDHSCSPDITLLVVLLQQDLGSDVIGSPNPCIQQLSGFLMQSYPEIYELDGA